MNEEPLGWEDDKLLFIEKYGEVNIFLNKVYGVFCFKPDGDWNTFSFLQEAKDYIDRSVEEREVKYNQRVLYWHGDFFEDKTIVNIRDKAYGSYRILFSDGTYTDDYYNVYHWDDELLQELRKARLAQIAATHRYQEAERAMEWVDIKETFGLKHKYAEEWDG